MSSVTTVNTSLNHQILPFAVSRHHQQDLRCHAVGSHSPGYSLSRQARGGMVAKAWLSIGSAEAAGRRHQPSQPCWGGLLT